MALASHHEIVRSCSSSDDDDEPTAADPWDLEFVSPHPDTVDGLHTREDAALCFENRRQAEAMGAVFLEPERGDAWADSLATVLAQVSSRAGPVKKLLPKSVTIMAHLLEDVVALMYPAMVAMAKGNKRAMFIGDDVQAATRLVFPGQLARFAVSEQCKACARLAKGSAVPAGVDLKMLARVVDAQELLPPLMNPDALYGLAAAIEYVAAEILELASNASNDMGHPTIKPRHIYMAIHNDEELSKMFAHSIITGGGVIPNIHSMLLKH